MQKKAKYGVPDEESPEMTREEMAKRIPYADLPEAVKAAFAKKPGRGPQKSPLKQKVSIRLSHDVAAALRAKGRGWQGLADEALREKFVS